MGQARSGLWLLPALLVLQACGSTPIGQQLSESFDAPAATQTGSPQPALDGSSAAPAASSTTGASTTAAAGTAERGTKQADKAPTTAQTTTAQNSSEAANAKQAPVAKPQARPQSPQPYRITIRLSAADPSAPAEVVTRSLREAGIGFEVETIERIQPPNSLRVTPESRGANP